MIYDEFNHYQETKKILGIHPIFHELLLRQSVERMNGIQAYKRYSNLIKYIRRDKRNLDKTKDPIKIEKSKKLIEKRETELNIIKEIHKFE